MKKKRLNNSVIALLVWVCSLLYLTPLLGSYGLFDPWETHYSEVSRSMIQRNDYISTFWQDKGFFSKPVLTFWLQSTGMRVFGINSPGNDDGEMAQSSKVEWATRLPVVLIASFAILAVFVLLSYFAGTFAGIVGAILLAITPFFALIARQTITDMPFVGLITISMVFFILGFLIDKKQSGGYLFSIKNFRIKISYFVYFLIIFFTLSQYLLFASNVNASFVIFKTRHQISGFFVFIPYLILAGDVIVSSILKKVPDYRHLINAGFLFAGLAILAKGFGALFIPGAAFLLYFLISGDWDRIKRFNIIHGLFIVIAISFPWHHAMIIRHGKVFFQEYIVHHHFKRAAIGVHGERGLFTYYLNELLFGLFPILILIPGVYFKIFRNLSQIVKPKTILDRFQFILINWGIVTFFLFSLMLTKFHHYIFPFIIPLILLSALYVKDLIDQKQSHLIPLILGMVLFLLVARELTLDPAHILNLFIYKYERLFPYEIGFTKPFFILSTIILAGGIILLIKRNILGVSLFLLSGFLFTSYIIYYYIPKVGKHWSQKSIHKIYYKCRKSNSERFIAWQLNWRGENFYSKNNMLPYMEKNSKPFIEYLRTYSRKNKNDKLQDRFLILESTRYKKLKILMDREFYNKSPGMYGGKKSNDLVKILGPNCEYIEPKWKKHYKQTNYKILTSPYPHNKFILARISF
jgi:4-amino-4-deoxy-L-arabinose transferase-like glycosyltransferase